MKRTINKTKESLNVWDIATSFKKQNKHLQYCQTSKTYYNYDESKKIWINISIEELKSLLLTFIESTYETYRTFNPKNLDGVLLVLQKNRFSMPDAKAEANSKGLLISFKNTVLNFKTLETCDHKPEHYSSHVLNCDYDPKASIMGTPMQEFLTSISNNNSRMLRVLRLSLYLILTNDLTYQVALYIYGPGGTGKSTFTNLLCHLLGSSASLNTTLRSLQSRFGLAPLKDKLLLVLSELPLSLGTEPQILKSIIGGDIVSSEKKYKNPEQLLPSSFVIITSNSLWNLVNSSSGMSRRFIYLLFNNKPTNTVSSYFNLGRDNTASGILTEYYPHLINWILGIHPDSLELFHRGGEYITSELNPDTLIVTNPIKAWILESLAPSDKSSLKIGAHSLDPLTLYGSYIKWSNQFNGEVGSIKSSQFTSLLLSNLVAMGWKVEKARLSSGFIIKGIQFKTSPEVADTHFLPISNDDFV